jgi:hypothetical protein
MTRRAAEPADPFDAGPFARLQAALHMPSPYATGAWRRGALAGAAAWLPLLLLTTLEGSVGRFFEDGRAHLQYLLALPFLVMAEPWCLVRLAAIWHQLAAGRVVVGEDLLALERLTTRARDALAHRGAELLLALVAYVVAIVLAVIGYPGDLSTWIGSEATILSVAGWWRATVSHPLLVVVVVAWLWRLAVWARLLGSVAALELRVVPAHPDLAGGLGFVALSLRAFAPVAFGFGSVFAAAALRPILLDGPPTPLSWLALAVGIIVALFVAPLLVFAVPLHHARARGILEYGALASEQGHRFEDRWLRGVAPAPPDPLEVQDFSATTDLYSIAANAWRMKLVPVTLKDVLVLALAAALPFLPVAALVMPLGEMLRGLAGLLL